MANNIKVLKLITGEELFAKVEKDGATLILNDVLQLHIKGSIESSSGRVEVELLPWIYSYKGKNIRLASSHVLIVDDATEQSEGRYIETMKQINQIKKIPQIN